MITSIDLFSGAGGLTTGLKDAGFNPVMAVEIEEDASHSYIKHTPTAIMQCKDIENVDFSMFSGEVDVVVGGPPCQPFSSGGLRGAQNDMRDMVPAFMHAVEIIRPRAVLMENVPGLTVGDRKTYFQTVVNHLGSLGYHVTWKILNAAKYGVPQTRQRLFIVGFKTRPFVFPNETHGTGTSQPFVTVNDILPTYQIGEMNASKVFYAKNPDLRPSPYHGQLFNGGGRPINRSEPAPTILASAGGNKTHFFDDLHIVPKYHTHLAQGGQPFTGFLPGARRLTILESALLQTFSKETVFHGSRSSQYKQIGNAVPPLLAKILGDAMVKQLEQRGDVSYYTVGMPVFTQADLFFEEVQTFMSRNARNAAVEQAVDNTLAQIDTYLGEDTLYLPIAEYRGAVDKVIAKKSASVRTMLLFLMFYRLEDKNWNLSDVPIGMRGKYGDKRLCEALTERSLTLHNNITAWGENLGTKGGVRTFDLLKDERFKDFLLVIKEATREEQINIANYFAYKFAESRKISTPLPPLPEDLMTFVRAKTLFYRLLDLQSEGHVQQFLIAALLQIFRAKQNIEVKTHHPHASDKFDNTAGDIEEYAQKRLIRAYEVTMRDDWQNRISGFAQKMQRFHLDKYIIIASNINNSEWAQPANMALSLNRYNHDIAVIDIQDVIHFLSAELTAQELRSVINQTYMLLANPNLSNRHDFIEAYRSIVEQWLDDIS